MTTAATHTTGTSERAGTPGSSGVSPLRRRHVVGALVLAVLLGFAVLASLVVGSQNLGLDGVWFGLTHRYQIPAPEGVDPAMNEAAIIVQTLRIPRTLLAIVAGAALGVAGTLTQGHTRNPIAEPGLLGVTAGAAFATAFGIAVLGLDSPIGYIWFALLGGLLTALLVFGVSSIGAGASNPLTLVLLGAGVTAFFWSASSAFALSDRSALDEMRRWVVGSVAGRGYDVLWVVLPFIVIGIGVAIVTGPTINLLNLGDDIARGVGVDVGRARLIGLVILSLLTGAATAACGPIALLGLVVPHVVRAITGPDYRWLLPYSALGGALLLLVCDVLGRIMAPAEIPAGAVVALIGAPFFVFLVRHRKMTAV